VQYIYKWYVPNTCCLSRPFCWWHLYICGRLQRALCSRKASVRSRCYWDMVWALEHKNQWRLDSDYFFSHSLRPPEAHLTLNGWNIPFINHAKCLGVIFNKGITWRLHIEMTEAKAFRTFIGIYSQLKNECLSSSIKLTLHKALIRSVMTYAWPAWELAADTCVLKQQCLQKKVICTTGNFWRCILVCDLCTDFVLPHVYHYITKLCRQQTKVQNHEN
jgi:hypothetical protein